MTAELIKSRTRRDTLVLDGFMYVHNVVKGERIYWECIEKRPYQCFGRAVTMGNRTYCSREHTHPPDPAKIELRKAEELCRDRAVATDSHASTIITSVVKMLPPTSNPYITAGNLLKTIRRVRKRAIMRVNAANKRTGITKSGSVVNSEQQQPMNESGRSVGSILNAAISDGVKARFVCLPDTSPESSDVKPANFLDGRTETPSQLACASMENAMKNSKTDVCAVNQLSNNSVLSEATVNRSNAVDQAASDSAPHASNSSRPTPTDEDVLREFIAMEESDNTANAASSGSGLGSKLPVARASCSSTSNIRTIRRRRQFNNSDKNVRQRFQGTVFGGGNAEGGTAQLLGIQSGSHFANSSLNGIRLDTLIDDTLNTQRSFTIRRNPREDFGTPNNSTIPLSSTARKRRSPTEVTPLPSSTPFRPTLNNVPITRNVKYLDSGLTLSFATSDQAGPSNERFIVFTTEKCLGMLDWHEWAIDVDTHALPDSFAYGQLLTIYARVEGRNMRCAWLLLSSRTVLPCVRALQALKLKGKNLNPKVIYTDYDRLLVMALEVEELEEKLGLPVEAQPVLNYFEDMFIGRPFRGGRRLPLFTLSVWNIHQHLVNSHHLPFEIWPPRIWGRDRCASCRLTLSDFETNLKEEYAATMRQYEHLIGGNLTAEGSDQLQTRNLKVKSIVANFRKSDTMGFLSEIAAQIQ
ncbi:FLYWCH-type zinc finger-containing protein 1 [Toxocara canis]|uniref:FLYWCH-type zinc finger-containing protein 1 n=1 Tax=Toxocara canis TaxID=6265 RepID=A0A0B2UPU4_TOXCA|nr:FLYWCH-type zinc finger-containing protein 1 [Toxocara canis]